MANKPMNLAYDPPPGVPRSNGVSEPRRMTIYDARPIAAHLSHSGQVRAGTKMVFAGLKNPEDRKALIEYLKEQH